MAVDFKLIGKRIQDKRKGLKKTQEDLAEYLDVSVGYVSNMEMFYKIIIEERI